MVAINFSASIPDEDEDRDATATLNVGGNFRKKSKGSEHAGGESIAAGWSKTKKDGTAYTGSDTIQIVVTGTNPACGPTVALASTTVANLPECYVCP